MDLNQLTVVIALTSVIVTMWAVLRQTRDTHLSLGTQILRDLENQFSASGIKKQCGKFARQYTKLRGRKLLSPNKFSENSSVFDFFETVGILLRRRVLDIELVESSFSYWFVPLWELAERDIEAWRKKHENHGYWRDCGYLYARLVRYEARQRKIPARKMSRAELDNFLKDLS